VEDGRLWNIWKIEEYRRQMRRTEVKGRRRTTKESDGRQGKVGRQEKRTEGTDGKGRGRKAREENRR
jgi:hypothetical protein